MTNDAAAPHLIADLVTALSNYMDKPWASHDWWSEVRETFFAAGGTFTTEHFNDPYQLGREHADAVTADLVRERDEALAAIARVKALHPNNGGWCNRCRAQHPCATVAAIDTHLRGDQ